MVGGMLMIIKKATSNDIDLLMSSRLETLKVVNNLSDDVIFDKELIDRTKEYFINSNQTTVLTLDNNVVIGCATICYFKIMPTISHPTGKRAHIMNVYTHENYRRQGIGLKMIKLLIEEAKQRGVTEISLDATQMGRPLYEKCGFVSTEEGMVLNIR